MSHSDHSHQHDHHHQPQLQHGHDIENDIDPKSVNKKDIDPSNPWSNPFCMPSEPLLYNPVTKKKESRIHQNKRLELEHFYDIIRSFEYYGTWQFERFQRKHYDYLMLPKKYQLLTPNIPKKFQKIKKAIIQNQSFITLILQCSTSFIQSSLNPTFINIDVDSIPSTMNMDKVRSTLKQVARDWSDLGAEERKKCYGPILSTLNELYPSSSYDRSTINILNPGCGLGRLPWEMASMGFSSQGNEFSYFMLLVSHFILNKCGGVANNRNKLYTIYPYCDIFTNVWNFDDQLKYCKIPDISPSMLNKLNKNNNKSFQLLSMTAGDFTEIYSSPLNQNKWDCIVSCFFIDTAHNVLQYLDVFRSCIKLNGYLLNIGPLLYHFEDMSDPSIELTYKEIIDLLPKFGFKIVKEIKNIKCGYTQNVSSMFQMHYNCSFWVAQKVKHITDDFYDDINNYNDVNNNNNNNNNNDRKQNDIDDDDDDDNDIFVGHNDIVIPKVQPPQNTSYLTDNLQFKKNDKTKNVNNKYANDDK